MRAGEIAVLIIVILGIGVIGMLAMPMFNKMPHSTDPTTNATVVNLTQPLIVGFGFSLSGLELGLLIGAIIAVIIFVYKVGFEQ